MGFRTTATSRRAALRRGVRHRRLAAVLSGFVGLVETVQCSGDGFGKFVNAFLGDSLEVDAVSLTDLVPIPPVSETDIVVSFPDLEGHALSVTSLVNFSLAGINYLYGGLRAVSVPSRTTFAQRSAQRRFAAQWW